MNACTAGENVRIHCYSVLLRLSCLSSSIEDKCVLLQSAHDWMETKKGRNVLIQIVTVTCIYTSSALLDK